MVYAYMLKSQPNLENKFSHIMDFIFKLMK